MLTTEPNLGHGGEANAVVAQIELGIVLSDEDVSQDPEIGAHILEGGHAVAVRLDDVGGGGQGEVGAADIEGDIGQGADAGAGHVATIVHIQDLRQGNVGVVGSHDQGGAGIGNSLAVIAQRVAIDGGAGHGELPVALFGDGHVGEGTRVQGGVGAAEDQLTTIGGGAGAGQVEGEHGLVDQTLGDHVVEDGSHVINGQGLVGHAEDAVEVGIVEVGARLVGGLCEGLALDGQAVDVDGIGGQVAGEAASSVLDGEGLAVGHVGGASAGVVLVVGQAGIALAGVGGHPQVGGAGVEQHLEALGRSADSDGAVVGHVHVVGQLLLVHAAGLGELVLGAQIGLLGQHILARLHKVLLLQDRHAVQLGAGQGHQHRNNSDGLEHSLAWLVVYSSSTNCPSECGP